MQRLYMLVLLVCAAGHAAAWRKVVPKSHIREHTQAHASTGGNAHAAKIVWGCNTLDRGVTLTFDDGPSDGTSLLLDHLHNMSISATFFVVGGQAVLRPDIVKRAHEEGHTIGIHTWTHTNLTKLWEAKDLEALKHEIDGTAELLQSLTGVRPHLVRPPYGAVSLELAQWLTAKNYTTVLWNGGCLDWWMNDMNASLPYLINGMADTGSLLCLHDSYRSTCEGVTALVNLLTTATPQTTVNPQGRKIISMPECLGYV